VACARPEGDCPRASPSPASGLGERMSMWNEDMLKLISLLLFTRAAPAGKRS